MKKALLVVLCLVPVCVSFAPPPGVTRRRPRETKVFTGGKEDMKRRLLQEASSPWRTVRGFFFGAFGLSAAVGGFTALTQLAASVAGREDALPLTQSLTNVGVDAAVVVASIVGWSLDQKAAADVTREPLPALTQDESEERTSQLLRLRVSVGLGDARREASLETLRAVAKQSVIVVGGPTPSVDDALRDAFIQQKLFVDAETLVVPVRLDPTTGDLDPADDDRPMYRAGFVAVPLDDGWADFLRTEIATAKDQGANTASKDGIVIAVRKDASTARRGVGKPPWKQLIDDIQREASSSSS